MDKKTTAKKTKPYKFLPQFAPLQVEVLLDEGIKGNPNAHVIQLQIEDIQYMAGMMRIIVNDYRS